MVKLNVIINTRSFVIINLYSLTIRFCHGSIEIAHLHLICLIHGKKVRLWVTRWCRTCLTSIRSRFILCDALFLVVRWVFKAERLLHNQKQLFDSAILLIFEIFETLNLVHDSAVHRSLI